MASELLLIPGEAVMIAGFEEWTVTSTRAGRGKGLPDQGADNHRFPEGHGVTVLTSGLDSP